MSYNEYEQYINDEEYGVEYIELMDYACESEGIERMFKNVLLNYEGRTPLQTCIEKVLKDIYSDMETMLYRYSYDRNKDEIAKRECKNKYIEEMMSFYLEKRIDAIIDSTIKQKKESISKETYK